MFPAQLGILPVFIILRNLNLTNNLFGLAMLYSSALSLPVFIFSMFFKTLPMALAESAKIDGANEFIVYARIMLPLSSPIIFTVALLNLITVWNDFFLPLVFLPSPRNYTMTLGVYRYTTNFIQKWNLIFPAASLAVVPIVIIFIFFSDKVISGIARGAIKQ